MLVNPAMTGVFGGKLRFSNDYRSQWMGVTKAFTSIHASLDLPVGKKHNRSSYFGGGLLLMKDQAGSGPLKTTSFLVSGSYTLSVDQGDNYLSAGIQTGMNQMSFDITEATWESQWNGDSFDRTGIFYQDLPRTVAVTPEMNAGVFWHYLPDFDNYVYLGFSGYHLFEQGPSFYADNINLVDRKYMINGGGAYCLNKDRSAWIVPRALFQLQGGQQEITAGFSIKNKMQFGSRFTRFRKDVNFSLGAYNRFDDALIFAFTFEYSNFCLGFSYDYTTSSLKDQSGNAFEITLAILNSGRVGGRVRNTNRMPKFF